MSPDHDSNSIQVDDARPRKRRPQFSLRGLFIVMTICAIGLSLVVSFPDFFLDETWPGLLLIWLMFYLPPSLALCGSAWWFGRKRVSWYKWEFLVLIVPYLVWASLMIIDGSGKGGWGNLYEPVPLAFASALAPLGRITLVKTTISPRAVAIVGLLGVCAVAVALWGWFPCWHLPE